MFVGENEIEEDSGFRLIEEDSGFRLKFVFFWEKFRLFRIANWKFVGRCCLCDLWVFWNWFRPIRT